MRKKALKKGIVMMTAVLSAAGILFGVHAQAVYAAEMKVAASASEIAVGEEVTVDISTSQVETDSPVIAVYFDKDYLKLETCSVDYTGGDNGLITIEEENAKLTFSGKTEGNAQIQVKAELSDTGETVDKTTAVQIGNAGGAQSANAYLKSLSVTPGTMTPEFSPEVTKYTIDVAEDVESVSVTCSVAETTSKVIEAGGFKGLKKGSNQAVVTVQAADGSKCTYELTINRGAAVDAGAQAGDEEGAEEEIMPISLDTDTIPVGGETIYSSFLVNTTFDDALLPEGFTKETYSYKGTDVESAYFAAGDVRLLYLSTGDKTSQDFRLYYEDTDTFMDLLQLKGTDGKFIMPVRYQAQIKIPDNYTGSYLPLDDKVISCYIYTELTDKQVTAEGQGETETQVMNEAGASLEEEAVRVEDLDAEVEFYLLYAMNNEGTEGFYLYDSVEGTYQRYVERDTSYELDQSYFKYKDIAHQRFAIMCVLIALLVVAVFCIINLVLKNKELKSDLCDDEAEDDDDDNHDDGDDGSNEADGGEMPPAALPKNKVSRKEETVSQEMDEGSLEEKIISQIQVADTEPDTVQKQQEELKKQEQPKREERNQVRTNPVRRSSDFKMINLSREPESGGLDDDFEFEFINLDDD